MRLSTAIPDLADLTALHLPWPVLAGLAVVLAALTVLGRALHRMAPEIFDLLRRLVVLRHIERMAAHHGRDVLPALQPLLHELRDAGDAPALDPPASIPPGPAADGTVA
jgi:hypothetical protein